MQESIFNDKYAGEESSESEEVEELLTTDQPEAPVETSRRDPVPDSESNEADGAQSADASAPRQAPAVTQIDQTFEMFDAANESSSTEEAQPS